MENVCKCQTVDRWSLSLFLCLLLFIVPFFKLCKLALQSKQVVSHSRFISSPGLSFKRHARHVATGRLGTGEDPVCSWMLILAAKSCHRTSVFASKTRILRFKHPTSGRVSWHQVTPCHVTWPPSLHQTRSWKLVSSRTLSTAYQWCSWALVPLLRRLWSNGHFHALRHLWCAGCACGSGTWKQRWRRNLGQSVTSERR